jgi:hypothetical protein
MADMLEIVIVVNFWGHGITVRFGELRKENQDSASA